ncbi:hypothetical protein AMELA_G00151990 [Ameiurus melas]|uniref:DNA-binding protein inhibitor ID-4 n=1 Tax=Ameiurus melas TaxID=219545 RepID=A0A7J6AKU2_AMEME|nr:hypothetical protein AMELA_G00151990 [Ameiurus melas]
MDQSVSLLSRASSGRPVRYINHHTAQLWSRSARQNLTLSNRPGTMKATSPVLPIRRTHVSSHAQDLGIWRSKSAWDEPLGVLCDMNDCYSRLKELVPSLPQDRSVSKMEILQHVIDYILDLQIALDSASPQAQRRPGQAGGSSSPESDLSSFQISHSAREMNTDDQITI